MIYKVFPLIASLIIAVSSDGISHTETKNPIAEVNNTSSFDTKAEQLYNNLHCNASALPQLDAFKKGLAGFYDLKRKGLVKRDILTVVDFSLSANTKRMWVIDLANKTIKFHSLVAHGRNTGDEFASTFSNKSESFQSSLGFYSTGEIYTGKHGMSLKLDGLEKGVNDNARSRAVVIHGADYVSERFIRNHRRLGRSQGCPAIPVELTKDIINTIKNGSCLYIHHPSRTTAKYGQLFS